MDSARSLYARIPAGARHRIKYLFPKSLLRWYAHRNTDVYLISYPKCGRTWLRLMIGRAISQHYALPDDEQILFLNWKSKPHPDLPRITVVHDDHPMLKAPEELEISKDKYRDKKVIFLARDPRDVIVSSYFEAKKRSQLFGDNPHETRKPVFEGNFSEFLEQHRGSFDTILAYYNIWAENRYVPRDFLLVRYESLRADACSQLRQVLDFLGLNQIGEETIAEAVQFASFDHMRQMEAEGRFQSAVLNPADAKDQESYKTRKGKVGGYAGYLTSQQTEVLNRKMEALSDFYEYKA